MGYLRDIVLGAVLFSFVIVGITIFVSNLATETSHTLDKDLSELSVLNDINSQTQNLTDAINQQTLQGSVADIFFSIPTAIFGFLKITFSAISNTLSLIISSGSEYFHLPAVLMLIILSGITISVGYAVMAAITKVNP